MEVMRGMRILELFRRQNPEDLLLGGMGDGRWENGKSTTALRILAWKQLEGQDSVCRDREDGERPRSGGVRTRLRWLS